MLNGGMFHLMHMATPNEEHVSLIRGLIWFNFANSSDFIITTLQLLLLLLTIII